jgi:hypothetical protein
MVPQRHRSSFLLLPLAATAAFAQQQQNPSPMVDHTRAHTRLKEESPPGRREQLSTGTLFIPAKLREAKRLPLFFHFHGSAWIPEVAAARSGRYAVISVESGTGSSTYAKRFSDRDRFGAMLREATEKTGVTFGPISLTAWSAGHGAIREILSVPEYYDRVQKVLLLDGLHTGYVNGKPGPLESGLEPDHLEIFLKFAKDAVAGRKTMGHYALRDFSGYLCKHYGNGRLAGLSTRSETARRPALGTFENSTIERSAGWKISVDRLRGQFRARSRR